MIASPVTESDRRPVLIRAEAVVDGAGRWDIPGVVLVDGLKVLAAGSPQRIGTMSTARVIDLPRSVVMPGLVNAHAHLDLSHIGPVAYHDDFTHWVDRVRGARATDGTSIAASVRFGAKLARMGGTAFIGDIAGARSIVPVEALREAGLPGVSFVEVFGIGGRQQAAIDLMHHFSEVTPSLKHGVHLGLQPHAPYSCGLEVYRAAAAMGVPLATHLAESLEEIDFVRHARGPLARYLRELGVWDDSIRGAGVHPVEYLKDPLSHSFWLVAHVNYVDDEGISLLARSSASVAYCPRASEYFGHPCGGPAAHRYRDMLVAGVNVCLGTDSLLCLDTPDRISILDEMRLLHRRDGTPPQSLLRMATINGAKALGVAPSLVTIAPGRIAGLLAVDIEPDATTDPVTRALQGAASPRWAVGPLVGDGP